MRDNIFKLTIFDNLLSKLLASYGFDTCSFDTAHCNFSTLSIFSLICSDYSPVIGWRDQLWKNDPVNAHCHPEQRPGLPVQLGGKRTEEGLQGDSNVGLHVWWVGRLIDIELNLKKKYNHCVTVVLGADQYNHQYNHSLLLTTGSWPVLTTVECWSLNSLLLL